MKDAMYAAELTNRLSVRGIGINLTYTLFSLIVIVDQLLLPMLRVGTVSFKISYFLLVFWLLHWILPHRKSIDEIRDIKKVSGIFAFVLTCILLGELWLTSVFIVTSYYETVRGMLTFILAALAFGLGRSSVRFRMEWLIPIFFTAITLNFMFIIFRNDLPLWIINFYYPERATSDAVGFQSVEDIITLSRPRGLFGNPNASMLMVNLIVLFIHLGIRNNVLRIKSVATAGFLIILPVFLAAVLASRGEFIVAMVLAFLNYRALKTGYNRSIRKTLTILVVAVLTMLSFVVMRYGDDIGVASNIERIYELQQIFESKESDVDRASTFERPLIALDRFQGRFFRSPLFGTGISAADENHFSDGTQYFHNDWFYILAVAGVFGFLALVWLLRFFLARIGWPILIPFILPGLINTFMLNIPAFIAYFGMSGVLMAVLRRGAEARLK